MTLGLWLVDPFFDVFDLLISWLVFDKAANSFLAESFSDGGGNGSELLVDVLPISFRAFKPLFEVGNFSFLGGDFD